jgi:23S rRNA-/tRNA-specific pseudouridylate synthase
MPTIFKFIALNEEAKTRLDVFLSHKLPDVSRSKIQASIEKGLVKVNGAEAKKRHEIKNINQFISMSTFVDYAGVE